MIASVTNFRRFLPGKYQELRLVSLRVEREFLPHNKLEVVQNEQV